MNNGNYENTSQNGFCNDPQNNLPKPGNDLIRTDQYWVEVQLELEDVHLQNASYESQADAANQEQENAHEERNL